MTLGVRVAAFDSENRVLLVRHQYLTGWYLPGGGVDAGETLAEAARRELYEETGYGCNLDLVLLSMYFNRMGTGRDHVGLFKAVLTGQDADWRRPVMEIAELQLFAMDALPEGLSPATQRRLHEIADNRAPQPYW
ncbi:Diadenosine hexaphosphate hydrolase [Pseudovibrio axinellae]|uniref:Diadenosine hexaphosphate hydrolase n=1 Tax=Pseudovibrio axinellae TaxID=989403 RepID=A0A165XTC6_9HYPH|nr:NUDIX domain-containing protein [Pseudovibrio axinellae]KZL18019.1 Diadenosine hexaphosphate hydrolase [Pseudovibrio axinellae]SER13300.1 ADP-ribose pyrophosphatase YjhB, NUDIX family [Pseudovibrio axinellae]